MTASAILAPVKTCTKCGQCKPATTEFFLTRDATKGTLKFECKTCGTIYRKAYYAENKASLLADSKSYRLENLAVITAQKKANYAANRAAVIQKNQAYRAANREAARSRAATYGRKRTASDPVYAMSRRVRALISVRLRAGGYTKKSRSHEILGCDWDTFKAHIERQFLKGMSWENRSEWQLDHVVPVATARTEADIIALNHHTNLRPLWSALNRAKSDTITHLI